VSEVWWGSRGVVSCPASRIRYHYLRIYLPHFKRTLFTLEKKG
jgi:hypothetical protein